MKYKVTFTLTANRSPVSSHYRPNWISDSKPEQNCAQLLFTDKPSISYGESRDCILEPFAKQLWNNVKIGDVLKCMEGLTEVGEAIILEILDES